MPVARPRLTWRLAPGSENWRQVAYELELTLAGQGPIDLGVIQSAESCFVECRSTPSHQKRGERCACGRMRLTEHACAMYVLLTASRAADYEHGFA